MKKEVLERRMRQHITRLRGTMGVAVKSLNGAYEFYHKEHEVFHAASIIKIPILLELYRQVEQQTLSLERRMVLSDDHKVGGAGVLNELHEGLILTIKDLAILMIVVSDNTASNMLIDVVGEERVNCLLRQMGMRNSALRKKFMIELADPSIINLISPYDAMVIMERLYEGEILSKPLTAEVLDILSRQQYREKIPLLLPEDLQVANKTGEVTGVRHDVGIVFLQDNPYVLSLMTKDVADNLEADRTIAEISKILFDFFAEKSQP
jgi:beta-lactamase class A